MADTSNPHTNLDRHIKALRPAYEVAGQATAIIEADGDNAREKATALIHADRIATARRVLEGLADTGFLYDSDDLLKLANNPTALEALLLKEEVERLCRAYEGHVTQSGYWNRLDLTDAERAIMVNGMTLALQSALGLTVEGDR